MTYAQNQLTLSYYAHVADMNNRQMGHRGIWRDTPAHRDNLARQIKRVRNNMRRMGLSVKGGKVNLKMKI